MTQDLQREQEKKVLCWACTKPIHESQLGGVKNIGGKECWFHRPCLTAILEVESQATTDGRREGAIEFAEEVEKLIDEDMQASLKREVPVKDKLTAEVGFREGLATAMGIIGVARLSRGKAQAYEYMRAEVKRIKGEHGKVQ